MRINPNSTSDLLSALEQTQQQVSTDMQHIASGQSVNKPSDNPSAAGLLIENADQTSEADQFLRSIGSVQGEMQNADSALNSVITLLQRAITLGTEGANGTLNDSDRQALAVEAQGMQSQLIGLANLSYQGNYVFAGTATQSAPYVQDSSSPSGVRYVGNSEVNQLAVGSNLSVQTNLPGSQLFSNSGNDMFQAIQNLISSLQNGTGVDTAVSEVSQVYSYINSQRVFYGNSVSQLNSQQTYLNSETTQLAQQQNTLGSADMAKSMTDLESSEVSQQATLEAISQTQQASLFSYLK